ncbi:MAG: type I restriction-modification system subunit M N-terminal domain-containing protein [Thermomicrobiales bacterium]
MATEFKDIESRLWKVADTLRANSGLRSSEYSTPVLGLIFLKYADTLSAYDDLIENNTRCVTILEEMAQRLYREWFVHFRYPGHESVPSSKASWA